MIKPIHILVAGIIVYLIWAIIHHKKDKSLTLAVYLEYLLTAVLVLILLIGALI